MKQNGVNKQGTILTVTEAVETTLAARSREEEFGSNKYLQVVVTGQTGSHVQFNKKQRVRDEFTLVRKS